MKSFYKELYDAVNSDVNLSSELKDISVESFCNILIFKMSQLECFADTYNVISLVKNRKGYFLKHNFMDSLSGTSNSYMKKSLYGVDYYDTDESHENQEDEFFLSSFYNEELELELETYNKSSKKHIKKLLNFLKSEETAINILKKIKNEFIHDSEFSSFIFYNYILSSSNEDEHKFLKKIFDIYINENSGNDEVSSFFKKYNCNFPDSFSNVSNFLFENNSFKRNIISDINMRFKDLNIEGLSSDFFLSKLKNDSKTYFDSKDIEKNKEDIKNTLLMDINLSEILDNDIKSIKPTIDRYISLFINKDKNLILKPKFIKDDKINFKEMSIDNIEYKNARYNFLYDNLFNEYSNRNIFSYNNYLEYFLSGDDIKKSFYTLEKNGDIIASFLTKEISVFDEFNLYMKKSIGSDFSKQNKTHKIMKIYDLNIDSRYRSDEKLLNYTINYIFKISKKKNIPIFLSLNSNNDPSYTNKINLKFSEIANKKRLFYLSDSYKNNDENFLLKKIKDSNFLEYLYNKTHDYQFLSILENLALESDITSKKIIKEDIK